MEALAFMVFPLLQHLPDWVIDQAKTTEKGNVRGPLSKAAIRAGELLVTRRIPRADGVATP